MQINHLADDWLPRRPRLRPGLRVVRRDSRHLQVGIDPADRLILPDGEPARRLLGDLQAGRRPTLADPGSRGWCRELVERGLVVDADTLDQAHQGPVPREAVLSTFASAGPSAAERLAARAAARVAVDAAEPWHTIVRRAMATAGLVVAAPGERRDVHLVVDPAYQLLDELVRRSEPHLVVRTVAGRISIGPFVSPGLTACSRCVTAHRCDEDPGHATVMEQYAAGLDTRVPPDPVLLQIAAAWAVRDLIAYAEGDVPATWSSTVEIDPGLALARQTWLRHPGCGCCWGDELAAG